MAAQAVLNSYHQRCFWQKQRPGQEGHCREKAWETTGPGIHCLQARLQEKGKYEPLRVMQQAGFRATGGAKGQKECSAGTSSAGGTSRARPHLGPRQMIDRNAPIIAERAAHSQELDHGSGGCESDTLPGGTSYQLLRCTPCESYIHISEYKLCTLLPL